MKEFSDGCRDGLPIGLGYFPVSFAFGILAAEAGLSWWQGTIISLFNLTSAGQFAGLTIMAAGGTLLEMAISQFVINLRYSLMSITLSQKVDDSVRGIKRYLFPYSVTDEIFGVASARRRSFAGNPSASVSSTGDVSYSYWRGLRILPVAGWTLGTLTGALLGSILPQDLMNAMSSMLYAMFIAIIIPVAKKNRPVLIAIILAVILSCGFTFLPRAVPALAKLSISSGMAVIICAVVASLVAAALFPIREEADSPAASAVADAAGAASTADVGRGEGRS
ncbi:MAG: AzlC family ABC transporter permease [Firmicutes bacterium]|nr:AzlC family ABC transporter permease [Bacillota bacterium]